MANVGDRVIVLGYEDRGPGVVDGHSRRLVYVQWERDAAQPEPFPGPWYRDPRVDRPGKLIAGVGVPRAHVKAVRRG